MHPTIQTKGGEVVTLGECIRQRRKYLGYSMAELGRKAGVSAAAISRYELGQREISVEMGKKIAKELNISTSVLFGLTPEFDDTDIEETANLSKMKELSDIIVATDILKEIIYLPHPDAEPILKAYDCLNEIGKQKAIERVEELTEIPRYRAAPVQEPQDTECKGGEEE